MFALCAVCVAITSANTRLPKGADLLTLKQSFRALAYDLHPDRSPDPDAAATFAQLCSEYDALVAEAARADVARRDDESLQLLVGVGGVATLAWGFTAGADPLLTALALALTLGVASLVPSSSSARARHGGLAGERPIAALVAVGGVSDDPQKELASVQDELERVRKLLDEQERVRAQLELTRAQIAELLREEG